MNCLYIMKLNHFLVVSFENILPFCGLSFCFIYGFLFCAEVLSLIRAYLFIFVFIFIRRWTKKDHDVVYVKSILPMISSKSFIVSNLTFRSLIHFEFIFVYGVRECSNLFLCMVLHVAVLFS